MTQEWLNTSNISSYEFSYDFPKLCINFAMFTHTLLPDSTQIFTVYGTTNTDAGEGIGMKRGIRKFDLKNN